LANIGWGQGTWGNNAWGGQLDVAVSPTGVAATSAVGTVAATSVFIIEVTGIAGTGAIGTAVASIPITAVVTGVEASMPFGGWGIDGFGSGSWGGIVAQGIPIGGTTATPVVGTAQGADGESVVGDCNLTLTGVVGTSAVGSALAGAGALVTETGLTGTVSFGDESVVGDCNLTLTGVSATTNLGGYSSTTITKTVTVQSVSGSNKYFIDGVQQQTQELYEGNTYRFDTSDSSVSGHPFRFSTTSDGTHNSGEPYSTGVTYNSYAGSAGAYTQITIASDAPTLYYYCQNHSGMGGTANTPFVYKVNGTTGAPTTGVAGTSALGTVTTDQTAVVIPDGPVGVSATGTLAMQGSCVLTVTGVSATGATGEENVWGDIIPSQTPTWTEIAA